MAMFLATFARFVATAAVLHMRFVSARVAYADSFGYTHAQNGLLRRIVLHTRYGYEPIAHNVQYFSHAELPVLCDSDPQLTQTIAYVIR
jgi:hypothetical protein